MKAFEEALRFSSCHVLPFVMDKSRLVSSTAVFTLLIRFVSVNIESGIRLYR